MGTHLFKWTSPADEVYVTGTFDDWSKSVKLTKDAGIFTKQVDLPAASADIYYKFVVDGDWIIDSTQSTAKDAKGNENNILRKEDIQPHAVSAIQSRVGPGATSAALAGAVPQEKNKTSSEPHMPGDFPESPSKETPGAKAGEPSASDFFSMGDIVPDFSAYKTAARPDTDPSKQYTYGEKATAAGAGVLGAAGAARGAAIASAKNAGEKAKETITGGSKEGEQSFGVSPLPATSGIGNPIQTKPGEKLPPSSDYTSNTTTSHVKLDRESYEKSDAYPTAGADAGSAKTRGATIIPESSLPMGSNVSKGPADLAAIRSAAGGDTSTAALAGEQPIRPRGVPEVVHDSHQEANASPEAAAKPSATADKSAVEQELKDKVPEEKPTSESSSAKPATAGGIGAVAAGAAASSGGFGSKISSLFGGGSKNEKPADAVPETVKESEKAANASPEAAANPEAVQEKSEVERELKSKIAPSQSAGEPAPVASAATTATAPHPQIGSEGGQGKDTAQDTDAASSDTKDKAKQGGIIAGVTGAATAAGGAAYAATQSAKDKATGSSDTSKDTASGGKPPPTSAEGTTSSTITNVQDIPATHATQSASAFSNDPTIADDSTAGAIAAATGAGTLSSQTSTTPASKDDPVVPAAASGATASSSDKKDAPALNTSKETPAQSVATEAKQIASEPSSSAAVAATTPAEKKDDEREGRLKAQPDTPKQRILEDDVSPHTRPAVTTGVTEGTVTNKSEAPKHKRGVSEATGKALAGADSPSSSSAGSPTTGAEGKKKSGGLKGFFRKLRATKEAP